MSSALLLLAASAAIAASPELEEAAARVLSGEGDAAAIVELSTGRLIFEHRPQWISERRVVAGSVIKLFTAYAMLEEGLADRETKCTGKHVDRFGVERPCWLRAGHNEVRFNRAIADSCNVWFYAQSESLPPAAFLRTLQLFGIGEPIDTDIKNAIRDLVPAAISERDLPDLAVGDAIAMEVSPLSLVRAVSAIATRGRLITPSRARAPKIEQPAFERRHLERIAQAMEEAVESGTLAETLRGLDVAAKTGTAKKRGSKGTRALVAGFLPRRDPRFAFVVIKGEGRGATDAGPAARALLEVLLGRRAKDPSTVEVVVLSRQKPKSIAVAGGCRTAEGLIDRLEVDGNRVKACRGARCTRAPRIELDCVRAELGEDRRRYGRHVRATVKDGELRTIASVDVEDYVAGVVESEDAGAPREAKRALSVVARTFALYAAKHPRHEDAALCDLTHCQAFKEIAPLRSRPERGVLVGSRGELAPVFFHSTCGGHTVDAQRVWPELDSAEIGGVEDLFCKQSPHARWIAEIKDRDLSAAIAAFAGKRFDPATLHLESIEPDATRWRISDSAQTTEVRGEELHLGLARVLGFGVIKSSDFTAVRAGENFRLRGRGLGHRAGLCQYGAAARAEAGHDAAAILRAYFPKLTVRGGEPSGPPAISVEGSSKHTALFQAACNDIERELGRASSPTRFTLVQSETIDDFVQRSGRTRAEVAGLEGRTIHLMPEEVLARAGELAPIARHECVHAWLTASRIARGSRVVEETLALGFAGQAARLPPARPLSRSELAMAEKVLLSPRDRRELEAMLARAVATIWPIARTMDAIGLREALGARDWTQTRLGDGLRAE